KAAMLTVALLASLLYSVCTSCPNGFELVRNGDCYQQIEPNYNTYAPNGAAYLKSRCSDLNSQAVIIRNEEDHDYWYQVAKKDHLAGLDYGNVMLGIECDPSKQYKWMDGSTIDFKPEGTDSALTSQCNLNNQLCMWYINPANGNWTKACNNNKFSDMYCVIPPSPSTYIPDDYCREFSHDEDDNICYQVGATPANWTEAASVCRSFGSNVISIHNEQENSFVRRLAISKGLVNGLMLGATANKKNEYKWADGSEWDYDNFAPGFPIDGLGDCTAMETNNVKGPWINLDCSTELPFACVRTPQGSDPVCDAALRQEGDIIFSPGFPNDASIPCDFLLKVDPGMLVQVEILFLEANSCCDHLILSEGSLGGPVIADLTGEQNGEGQVFNTTSQSIMRASWQPKGGVNVKGMMVS
ncbi:hypothetical protein PFISCL1PPCAC_19123, partial [Pristionchus fissidentatus]